MPFGPGTARSDRYGAIEALTEPALANGFTLDRRQVAIDRPIKVLGLHDIRITLHPEVRVSVKANVAQSQEAAVLQAEAAEPDEPATVAEAEAEPEPEAAEDAEAAAEAGGDQPQTG